MSDALCNVFCEVKIMKRCIIASLILILCARLVFPVSSSLYEIEALSTSDQYAISETDTYESVAVISLSLTAEYAVSQTYSVNAGIELPVPLSKVNGWMLY